MFKRLHFARAFELSDPEGKFSHFQASRSTIRVYFAKFVKILSFVMFEVHHHSVSNTLRSAIFVISKLRPRLCAFFARFIKNLLRLQLKLLSVNLALEIWCSKCSSLCDNTDWNHWIMCITYSHVSGTTCLSIYLLHLKNCSQFSVTVNNSVFKNIFALQRVISANYGTPPW